MPLRLPPLAAKTPAVAGDCQQRRQQDPHQRRVAEQAQQPRHQLAVGEQTAQGNQHAGQRGPEGIAAQAPPVEGGDAHRLRQPLAVRGG